MHDMEIHDAANDVRKRLEEARRAAALLEHQLAGIESYIATVEGRLPDESSTEEGSEPDEEPDVELTVDDNDLSNMTRPAAIMTVLSSERRALSPSDLLFRLKAGGRTNDDTHKIGTALSRLKKRKLVRSRGYGRWAIGHSVPSSSNGSQGVRTMPAKGGDA